MFDGVNVTLPLFGALSAEPATHDIAQFERLKGGARAVDFERSGGFRSTQSASRERAGSAAEAGYQAQTEYMPPTS